VLLKGLGFSEIWILGLCLDLDLALVFQRSGFWFWFGSGFSFGFLWDLDLFGFGFSSEFRTWSFLTDLDFKLSGILGYSIFSVFKES